MPPLFDNKNPLAKSVFEPSALLREARRQKGLATVSVPSVCVLDPDGDIVRRLKATGQARPATTPNFIRSQSVDRLRASSGVQWALRLPF